MAQNSDALQEPSMDELLASIREIIEENTGIPSQNNRQGDFAPADNRGQGGGTQRQAGGSSYAAMPNLKQDIRIQNDPAQGRMPDRAESPDNLNFYPAGGDSVYPNNASRSGREGYSRTSDMPPAGNNNYSQSPNPTRNFMQSGSPAPQGGSSYAGSAASRPIQESMNALAARIGLHGGASPARGMPSAARENALASPAAGGRNASPMQNAAAGRAQNPVYSRRMPQGRDGIAPGNSRDFSPPHFNAAPGRESSYQRENQPQSAFPPNGGGQPLNQNEAEHFDNRNDGGRRSPGTEPVRDSGILCSAGNAPYADVKMGEHRPSAQESRSGADSAFPADVERSAENLLRPYIAQWLDEHFKVLFEKILREEVQRFIQSMRPGR